MNAMIMVKIMASMMIVIVNRFIMTVVDNKGHNKDNDRSW